MAKLKKDLISAQDLQSFVANDSDFGFEMQVLNSLRSLDFECAHSGTYVDPVTGKIRQFDIRAAKDRGRCNLKLAVECKNLRPNRPLLLSAIPRKSDEAFHEVITHYQTSIMTMVRARNVDDSPVYKTGAWVAKKTDQVGRDQNENLIADDGETFERISQAMNSCQDLVQRNAQSVLNNPTPLPHYEVIVPVLVVPAGLLWQVDYGDEGDVQISPRNVSRSSIFQNHAWSAMHGMLGEIRYRISHLEIVTLDVLNQILPGWLSDSGFFPDCGL